MITPVLLDPGHGGKDPGAVNGKVKESVLNMQIGNRVFGLIANYMETRMTRFYLGVNETQNITIASRIERAKVLRSKSIISIHHNSFTNKKAKGLEVFYKKDCDISYRLARQIYMNMLNQCYNNGYTYLARGVKTAPLMILNSSPAPAVLVECGFMSNDSELAWLCSPKGQVNIATGIALGILGVIDGV